MRAIRTKELGARNTGLGLLTLLLVLTACTPAAPQPGGTSQGTSSPAQSTAAGPSATAGVPGDTDETGPPQTGDKVISAKVTLDWAWPGPGRAFKMAHGNPVPVAPPPAAPLPALSAIGSGRHPSETPPYDQLSFRFTGGFPGYDIEYVPELLADGSGLPVLLPGAGAILKVVFRGAQAHTADGTASTIERAPALAIGYPALTSYAPAGDFEGLLSYGIGVGRILSPVPETKIRVYEVEKIDKGQHLYVVAIQLDAASWK
ncbi:AMIN-like domain-containing (lipo)protein [Arthrobacter sp. RHLT1-20]